MDLFIILGIPAIVAFFMMFYKLSLMKTAVSQDTAHCYIKENGVDIREKNDTFLYSRTLKTPKPKQKQ